MNKLFVTALVLALQFVLSSGCSPSAPPPPAQHLTGLDLHGAPVDPFQVAAKGFVLFFVSTECPVSNRYAPEIQRLASTFQPRGLQFWLVYPNADETAPAVAQHVRDFHLQIPALRDPEHRLVRRAGARVTPEAAVFSADRRLIYRGRIDNRFPDLGQERTVVTEHDLESVLQALLKKGGAENFRETIAVGCSIP